MTVSIFEIFLQIMKEFDEGVRGAGKEPGLIYSSKVRTGSMPRVQLFVLTASVIWMEFERVRTTWLA